MGQSSNDNTLAGVFGQIPADLLADQSLTFVLSNLGIAFSHLLVGGIFVWLAYKSVLLRRTLLIYALIGLFVSCAIDRLVQIAPVPEWLHLFSDLFTASTALISATLFWMQRFHILRIVYQFKYTIGLLKNLDLLDEASRKVKK